MPADHPLATWLSFAAILLVLLVVELGFNSRKTPLSLRRAGWWSATVVTAAAIFCGVLGLVETRDHAVQFAAGYVVEFSLSVDNLLVFIMVLHYFAVPASLQPTVLKWGILGAIVLRGLMILGASWLLNELTWVIYLMGAMLVITGIKMLTQSDGEPVMVDRNPLLRAARRFLPLSEQFAGTDFFVRQAGRLVATPLLLVVLVIEWTDLVFATDSIPAIFAITRDPFLVYTSNIFAIMGLRALFFVLAASIARFAYLRLGVAAVLMLVGAKMLIAHWTVIPAGWSLLVVVVVLGGSVVASLLKARSATPG
ncbi:MAG: TerC/Alx family metal homeostasis membrane protein, partial [Gemmatimonadota bacterium]